MIGRGLRRLYLGALGAILLTGSVFAARGPFLPPKEGPVGEKHRPVIEGLAAQNEIGDGAIWKIYLRAKDPDGDLDRVHVVFSGPDAITNSLLPQPEKTAALNGYILVWARLAGPGRTTSRVQADVTVRVEDRAGNVSEPTTLKFEVGTFGGDDKFQPPPEFNTANKLGQAEFDLKTDDSLDDGRTGGMLYRR